jgi:hypothetical protein
LASAVWSAARSETAKKKVFTKICDWFDLHLSDLEKWQEKVKDQLL